LVITTPHIRWRRLEGTDSSAHRNLAVEEALYRAISTGVQTKPTVRLWTNPKAVVLGRFQEASVEADIRQCEVNGVQIARRFTGGGTVFHDGGTLNLTLISPHSSSADLKFQDRNLQLVKETLEALGLRCSTSRNAILVDGRKVCGAAAAVGSRFALWHCSILVDADTRLLELVLAPSKSPTNSRFVHSRWQEVTTLAKALSRQTTVGEVAATLEETIRIRMEVELEAEPLSIEEEQYSETLYFRKYSLREWNLEGNRKVPEESELIEGLTRQLPYASARPP
jgi:lipoate-protein ligase A